MSEVHTPDNWVKLKLLLKSGEISEKLLVGWSGGYLYGDSWRISSQPEKVTKEGDYWVFTTRSGNQYRCHEEAQCMRRNTAHIFEQLKTHKLVESVEVVDV
jgi:hypothetical protein